MMVVDRIFHIKIGLAAALLMTPMMSRGQAPQDAPELAAAEIRDLLQVGKHTEAVERGTLAWRRSPFDPELALAFADASRANGEQLQARVAVERALMVAPPPAAPGDARKAVAYGELLLRAGADPKDVLQRVLEPAKKADPEGRDAYLAIGSLALDHQDRELAAENFREGLKRHPDEPAFALGLERSGLELPRALQDPRNGIASYLDLALGIEPNFVEALLYKADKLVGSRDPAGAKEVIKQVLVINPDHPEAWAHLAALALLEDDAREAERASARARKFREDNPRVSQIIGTILAGHYHFAEAIVYLKRAAREDPESASILFELGSNQLRFGQLEEGWENVALAHHRNPYHVAAFNLMALRDKISDYPVREKDGVLLRMSSEDMAVFGDRALDLAARAKQTLEEKYQIELSQPVMVEMLPKQEDFAIRTFGLPGGESFLGVCFGPLITMTSPRGRLGRANWEAVLWHEMAHTITLDATRHRIPRWLSEGISVYEERAERPGWGQGMNSDFRERILTDRLPPIARLDESFAGPDILFGYYHASLVVEYIVERYGIGAMRSILAELSAGMPLGKALAAHTVAPDELESLFLIHAKSTAGAYGPDLNWEKLTDDEYLAYRKDPAAWVAAHPLRYAAVMMRVSQLAEEGKWDEAKALLNGIIAAEPNNREPFNPYRSLAAACRGLDDAAGERAALTKLLELDANESGAAARLLELGRSLGADERAVDAHRLLETNPFQEQAYRTLAMASREAGDIGSARDAFLSLLALRPRDAGRVHYELAILLQESSPAESKRHVLQALEENPRFLKALELLANLPPAP